MSVQTEDTGRETAYERGLRHGGNSSNSGGGNLGFLKKPVGPLPLWVWLVLGLFGALGYYVWAKHNAASKTSSTNTSTGTDTTDSSLIPQFVNQVYTGNNPPESPPLTTQPTQSYNPGPGTGTPGQGVGYGQSGPPQNGYQAITLAQAQTLLSAKNTYNPSGEKSQRPFIWNGSAYVPATVLTAGQQYYAGPTETAEINKKQKG
jgi:hypothetical protein